MTVGMDGYRVRLLDAVAAVLWLVTLWLLVRSSADTELSAMRAWGLACSAAAAAATVCAMVQCAAGKVLRAVHRAQLEDLLKARG